MNHKEDETGKVYKNWDDIIEKVRKGLNKIRKIKLDKFDINDYPFFINYNIPKFKIGQAVHYNLDSPENALGNNHQLQNLEQATIGILIPLERLLKFCISMTNRTLGTYWKVLKTLYIVNINSLRVDINILDIK